MTTTVVTTKITTKYLMGKTKWELANDYLDLCDAKDKIQDEHERLKARLVEQGNLTSELRAVVGEMVRVLKATTVSGYSVCSFCGTLWMDASAEHHLTGCWVPKTLDLLKRSGMEGGGEG